MMGGFGGGGVGDLSLAPSLRETVKTRLFTDMIRGFANEPAGVVMCVDTYTMRIISSVCKMSEMLEENIHLVENITMRQPNGQYLQRQPLPTLTAVYFITPTVESVNRLIADYRDKKRPMYGSCHLFFTSRLSDALFGKIKASAAIGKVAGFKELNLELVCTEANSFTLSSPESLLALFAPEDSPGATETKLQEQHRIASMLATLFATLGEMPHVRHSTRPIAASVGAILHSRLSEMASTGSGFPSRILSDAERPTILILDRSDDALSPLLHEFTYQAMVHDLLPVDGERYQYQYVGNNNQRISKEVLLNETDPLWLRLRHLHIADVGPLLHTEYKALLEANPEAAQLTKAGGDKGIKAMTEGLRSVPKFQEQSSRYSLHMAIMEELMSKYNAMCLEQVATVEQNMATSEDANGRMYKEAMKDLKVILEKQEVPLSAEDKMRLLMIYVTTQDGIKQDDRKKLLTLAGIAAEDQVAILNLFYLGVTLLQGTKPRKDAAAARKDKGAEASYDISRYAPPIKRHVEQLLGSGLSVSEFPFAGQSEAVLAATRGASGAESARGGKSSRPTKGGNSASEAPAQGRRLIVFVLGGLCYSELRALHEISRMTGRDILIGSTSMLTPKEYLASLKRLKPID